MSLASGDPRHGTYNRTDLLVAVMCTACSGTGEYDWGEIDIFSICATCGGIGVIGVCAQCYDSGDECEACGPA